MPIFPKPKSSIEKINLYISGQKQAGKINDADAYLLNANENPYGCSQKLRQKISHIALEAISKYPDGNATILKNAIAKQHQLKPENIVCSNGSDEIINLVALAYLEKGDEAIYSQYGFLIYRSAILAAGAKPVIAEEKNFKTDFDAIINAVNKNTKIVFIANPNNPTGSYLTRRQIQNLVESLPKNVILFLDNAYAEYVTKPDYSDALEFTMQYPNLITSRTFSKIYGLAALRVGWACADKNIIDTIQKIRSPFNVSYVSQICATEALDDQQFIEQSRALNARWRDNMIPKLRNIGINILDSQGNFILLQFEDKNQAEQARYFLEKNKIFLRSLNPYKMENALRYSCGLDEQNLKVFQCLKQFMQKYKK